MYLSTYLLIMNDYGRPISHGGLKFEIKTKTLPIVYGMQGYLVSLNDIKKAFLPNYQFSNCSVPFLADIDTKFRPDQPSWQQTLNDLASFCNTSRYSWLAYRMYTPRPTHSTPFYSYIPNVCRALSFDNFIVS